MIGAPFAGRIFLRRGPTDMRKGINGLCGLVQSVFGRKASDGSLFIFIGRRRNLLKALYWDKDGFALWSKRLERGTFAVSKEGNLEISRAELALLLEGVTVQVKKRSPRWLTS